MELIKKRNLEDIRNFLDEYLNKNLKEPQYGWFVDINIYKMYIPHKITTKKGSFIFVYNAYRSNVGSILESEFDLLLDQLRLIYIRTTKENAK